jgi:predicted nucleotide-binding protein
MSFGVLDTADDRQELITRVDLMRALQRAEPVLESMLDEIEHYWPLIEGNRAREAADELEPPEANSPMGDIFIVHGHDQSLKESVARTIEKLDLRPVILHEQPNQGRTIIEKLEGESAPAGFAIALLTPDDAGYLTGKPEEATPRARQNVILELGFFLGKLGRHRVCALFQRDVEMPSDYKGMAYIAADSDDWRMKLCTELKGAGYEIDVNKIV